MRITVEIPSVLRSYSEGASEIIVSAGNARAALQELRRLYPDLHRCVCDETGAVRQHVNLFVNSSLIRNQEEFDTTLVAGDVISIFQAVSGG